MPYRNGRRYDPGTAARTAKNAPTAPGLSHQPTTDPEGMRTMVNNLARNLVILEIPVRDHRGRVRHCRIGAELTEVPGLLLAPAVEMWDGRLRFGDGFTIAHHSGYAMIRIPGLPRDVAEECVARMGTITDWSGKARRYRWSALAPEVRAAIVEIEQWAGMVREMESPCRGCDAHVLHDEDCTGGDLR